MSDKFQLSNALAVFILDKRIRTWLMENNPKALLQAIEALCATGFSWPDGPNHCLKLRNQALEWLLALTEGRTPAQWAK